MEINKKNTTKIEDLNVSDEIKTFLFDSHGHCEDINEPIYKYSDVVKLIELITK